MAACQLGSRSIEAVRTDARPAPDACHALVNDQQPVAARTAPFASEPSVSNEARSTLRVPKSSKRDPRIDVLRGFALLTIFVDHLTGNFLGTLTLRNFAFCDAAELFVLLAGLSSMMAYGGTFEREGAGPALRRVGARCVRIYLFQIGLLLATLTILQRWLTHFGMEPHGIAPMLRGGVSGLKHGLVLHALPSNLNILPLYIILLALFPIIYLGMRRSPGLTLLGSAALWIAANQDPDLNLVNWMDGQGWFFNPFAWQFLFVIGVAAAFCQRHGRGLPRKRPLVWAAVAYVAFALLATAPWSNWGLDWRPIDIAIPDKTALAPLRLINVLALVYLLMTSAAFDRLARARWLGFMALCGRHSLEVFATGTLLSLLGRLLFRTFGTGWELQLLVNGVGFALLITVARVMERPRSRIAHASLRASGASHG